MSVFVPSNARVIVQGVTGREGSFHALRMKAAGTNIVGGVAPGKGGQQVDGIPVFDTVADAVVATRAQASVIFVPAPFALDAIMEAAASLPLIVCITEGIPVHDMMRVNATLPPGVTLIGPNCPGIVVSSQNINIGIMPADIFLNGRVGVVSRSGTLTYEVVADLSRAGIGQSVVIGIGGDPIGGVRFIDVLRAFENDQGTDAVVLIGEIGGDDEEIAADFTAKEMKKPVVAYIAGSSAPPGKRMGHAGAIISQGRGTAQAKKEALEASGVPVAATPMQITELVKRTL